MNAFPVLSLTIFLPLIGVICLLMIRGSDEEVTRNSRWVALWVSVATFLVSLLLWLDFVPGTAEFQFVERVEWLPAFDIAYHVGLDGISLFFVLLSTFLTPICVLASWKAVTKRVREYMIAFLVLETMMIGTFAALDFVLFYVFFEAVLIPMFIIIGVWGGPRRVYSAFKFFLYTLTGSVLLLVALLAMYIDAGTTDIPTLLAHNFPAEMQTWLWLALFASFAVKMPMWPVHTWLPDAHVEAPTAGSVILAGVLLKMGGYGFLRFSIPMLPLASDMFTPLIFTLSVIAVIYTSLVALAQEDMKKLIAYSSVAHMGFVTIGIFTATMQGIQGGVFQMISHGIVSAALFLCVGVVYDRMHSREISHYGGLVERMPKYAFVFMVFMLGSVGLPGTSGFVGEVLVMFGAFQASTWVALLAATGIILGAAYMLFLYRRVIFGKLEKEHLKGILDLEPREVAIFTPLVLMVFWLGIWSQPFLDLMDASVANLLQNYQAALAAADASSVAGTVIGK
jgi:NADH-quinone oxidoreductase subunit M